MYCSEDCLNADWSFAHKGECKKLYNLSQPLDPFKLVDYWMPSEDSSTVLSQSMLLRLITSIGLDNIKKTVFENRPMPSLLGNPRTKGFQDGKFEAATLEALLSLEDNFGKLSSEDINSMSSVSSMIKIMWDFF
jgi:hypothetical protein